MHSKWLGKAGIAALVVGAMGGTAGCAEERDPINRVQLNAMPKSFFLGAKYDDPADDPEFMARSMVIHVPYGESSSDELMFTNTVNSVSRIKWSIEGTGGDHLVGRVSFERITGTDGAGLTPKTAADRDPSLPLAQNDGIPVYDFHITSNFDIRRDYNSTTGEESNVIVENTSDRPWNERDYIRVDFSKNNVTTAYDFDTLALLGVYNGIDYEPMDIFVEDPNDANAPVLDIENGYFDVTNKLFANPKTIDLGDGWVLPGCMLPNLIAGGTAPDGNCNPNEITVRHAFKRIVDDDYEPEDWDGKKFEAYGAFLTERQGYARDYGVTDALWKRYISRYNIWKRSHAYANPDTMEGATSCYVDSDCEDVQAPAGKDPYTKGMSHCDTYNNKCTLPFRDRETKPIVWHYADGSPDMYYDATREAAEEWDTAMREAVIAARYAECRRYTADPSSCGTIVDGNFSMEEDAIHLTKEINACKRGEVPDTAPADCDALAADIASKRGYAQQVVDVATAPQMVIVCHSPVTDADPADCGKKGSIARLGDLRYSLLTNIATPETNSPWGIMSDANDPLTGEKVAASVNVWTHVNDLFSRGLVDTLRYINGELKTEDITEGKYVDQWVEAARQNKGAVLAPIMSQDERDKRVAAAAGTTVEKMHALDAKLNGTGKAATSRTGKRWGDKADLRQALVSGLRKVQQTTASLDATSQNAPIEQARLNLVRGSDIEAESITPAMQQLARDGYGSIALDTNSTVKATSIFQGLNPRLRRELQQRRESILAARGACIMGADEMLASAPLGYVALGDVLQQKFGKFNPSDSPAAQAERADKMKDYLRRRAQYAVISHEMGHSFALRHNFVSSSDAWNFRSQYWQLRTNDKALDGKDCASDGSSDGATCVGPRWLDPVSANETKNLIWMFAQSSTMEYAGEPTQDLLGLGVYDFGAARMFYGDVATVYTDGRFKSSQDAGAMAENHQDEFGGLLGYRYGDFSSPTHYSGLDGAANLIEKCTTVNPADYQPVNWDEEKDGKWHQVLDGHIVTNESGKSTRCTQPKVDFVQWDTLNDDPNASSGTKYKAIDKTNRVRVPHGFASDDWADLGNIAVYRHDNGADIYEQMQFWIAQQEMMHIFTSYRRGRRDFSLYGAFNRAISRYHEKMRDSAKAIALYTTLARDTVSEFNAGDDPEAFVGQVLKEIAEDNVVASSIAFDHFSHVFARPEPGDHGTIGSGDNVLRSFSDTAFANTGRALLSVANGVTGGFGNISLAGRPVENALADNKGRDYDRDYTLNVGSYYEKAFVASFFTESADNFISASRGDFVDPRYRAVSIADIFPDGYRRWMANNLTGDDEIKGVYVRGNGSGAGVQPPMLDADGYALLGTTSWWPTAGIETCFPEGEKLTCRDPLGNDPLNTNGIGPVVDPQVGWEQQKFVIIQSLLHITENARVTWTDQMRLWELGEESDPGFDNRVEFHSPNGHVYVAKSFGTETLLGKTVQKGIAARVLEWANILLQKAVVTQPVVRNGVTVGYAPLLDASGNVQYLSGGNPATSCATSEDCTKLTNYESVPSYLRRATMRFGFVPNSGLKGVY